MRAPVDHQRDQQRDDEHHDKADNGLRLVPNPHLVVHRATVHRDNERDGIEHENELHQRQLQVVHIEDNARQPEQRRGERLHQVHEILADSREQARHQGEHVEENEHQHESHRQLKQVEIERLSADEVDNQQRYHQSQLDDERRNAEDRRNARKRELYFRYFVLLMINLIKRWIMKTWKVEAAIIAVGMVLLGVIIKWGINDFIDKERIVSVKGLAEMEVPADKVIWPLMYKDIGNDPSLLYANMEQKNKAIVKFLESNGIAKEEISIAPPEVIDMQAERYGNRDIAYRYNATSVITVTSKNVDKVRKLMSEQAELLKQGIAISGGDYRYNVVYEFTGLNDVKPQMIEEATKNARAAAEKFAKDSDSSLGKIRNASQGQFSISDRDANTPYIKSIRVVTTVNYYLRR